MPSQPRRHSIVPWLDDADLYPQGDPGTIVELDGHLSWGLWIKSPFGKESDAILTVHAIRGDGTDGGVVTLAITNAIHIDYQSEPPAPTRYDREGTGRNDDGA